MTTRFTQVDLSNLPMPAVIEELDFEATFDQYRLTYVQQWDLARLADPSMPVYDVDGLETDPAMITGQATSYREMTTRARINDAARAVMLPFSTGSDLDALAALYAVERLDGETDRRLRMRVQLAPEAFASAGAQGGYEFHAMTVAPSLRHARAIRTAPGFVRVTCMGSVEFPAPSDGTLEIVRQRLHEDKIRPLTAAVTVAAPTVVETAIVAELTLYPGPSSAVVLASVQAALDAFIEATAWLGHDLKRSALFGRLHQEGVQAVNLIEPAADINLDETQCFRVTGMAITVEAERDE